MSETGTAFGDYETAEETAERLGKTTARIRQLAISERIPGAMKRGGSWWIPRSYRGGEAGIKALEGLSLERVEELVSTRTAARMIGLEDGERQVLMLRLGIKANTKSKVTRTRPLSLRDTAERTEMSHTQAWVLEGRAASKVRAALSESASGAE